MERISDICGIVKRFFVSSKSTKTKKAEIELNKLITVIGIVTACIIIFFMIRKIFNMY